MTSADWYFDFISPYSYLQLVELPNLNDVYDLHLRPVLLAALLNHWGQLGPAEIAPKRIFTYQQVNWLARRRGLSLVLPRAHPFNPLPLLRLAIHLGPSYRVIERLFAFVWRDGNIPDDRDAWGRLVEELGVTDVDRAIGDEAVKQNLRAQTDRAIEAGVFGVPTLVVGRALFWGNDSTEMARDYAVDPSAFHAGEAHIQRLPAAAVRRTVPRT